jgi:TRAP-type mannitol/chloroaromatic compound transport system substrate-binding protein
MRELLKKNPETQTDNTISIQSTQEIPQESKLQKQIEQIDYPENIDLQKAPISELLESYQKMKAEEQRLLDIKQEILTKQQDLQSELAKEIEKKKMAIANLISEIPSLQNKTQKLGEALGIDIYQ